MGIYFTQCVVPVAASIDYWPDRATVAAVLDLLVELGFAARPTGELEFVVCPPDGKRARATCTDGRWLEALPRERPLALAIDLAGRSDDEIWGEGGARSPDGLSRKYDFQGERAGTLRPEFCATAKVCLARHLAVVGLNSYSPVNVPCPGCKAEATVKTDEVDRARRVLGEGSVVGRFARRILPARCPACGERIDAGLLTARSHDAQTGEAFATRAPFFHFGVLLEPSPKATPADGRSSLHGPLADGLRRLTGVQFRALDEYA